MSKYNYEFKKKIVMSYRNGMGSYKNLVKYIKYHQIRVFISRFVFITHSKMKV